MPVRTVPGSASVAHDAEGKLFAPSAARNLQPLCDLLRRVAPAQGRALELASGTGQHVVGYARTLPGLHWQPTEVDAARRASIDAYVADSGLANLSPAVALDATAPGWSAQQAGQDLIVLSNLLHLISTEEAQILIAEAAAALSESGRLVIYGPFLRNGDLISEGDRAFHAAITANDPETGYKDDAAVIAWMQASGLVRIDPVEMPANNLALIANR